MTQGLCFRGRTILLIGALALSVPGAAAADLRDMLHLQAKSGHLPIPYNQTDEALREIYADPSISGNVLLFYTGRSQDADLWAHQNAQDGWNREHLWAQSRGVRPFPMKSDLHNLVPTDASVNQRRGNLDFDEGGGPEGEAPATFLDGDSFEPRDAVKGDVARALFYMDIRYEGTGGEPDLTLIDRTTPSGGHTIGSPTSAPQPARLSEGDNCDGDWLRLVALTST